VKGLGLRRFSPAIMTVLAWVAVWFTSARYVQGGSSSWHAIVAFLDRFAFRAFSGFPAAQQYAGELIHALDWLSTPTFATFASWAMFLVPLGFVARIMARARVRYGAVDPLDRLRAWTRARPVWTWVVLAILPALWGIRAFEIVYHRTELTPGAIAPILLASVAAQIAAARSVVTSFLSPTVDPGEEALIEIGPDEIAFDAVAVTNETRAAVGGLAALSVAMVVWLAALPIATLFRDPRLFAAVAVYSAVAIGGAALFRVGSRVAVGVDGVLVKGTSRTRFYAYRDLDGARVTRGDIELVRRGRVVLRLQLHGADAVRREAVVGRIHENIARVQRGEHAMAAQLVSSSTKEELARAASGGADYRAASLSREALWALIEGPTVDSDARRAAAEALVKTSDAGERARLRVAADHCADPRVRVALAELAEQEPLVHAAPGASRSTGAHAAASRT
jgi:hypothetical protein